MWNDEKLKSTELFQNEILKWHWDCNLNLLLTEIENF